MAKKIEKIDVWSGEIRDEAGGLDSLLKPLVEAGADFSFVVARRQPDKPGTGIVFVGGLKGSKQAKAAQAAGLTKTENPAALRVEASDKPGRLEKTIGAIAAAGISLRGVTASVIGSKCVFILGFDSADERDKAAKLLK